MTGAEYLTTEVLIAFWTELDTALRDELVASNGSLQEFLRSFHPVWNLFGRVHFNLAEHRRDAEAPFAFLANATVEPSPFGAIVVHSRSRFFRDLFEFLRYERSLKRGGVRVLSITQQTSDDPSGEMASKIFSLFDEYQSKENGKHTLRAMQENARQGFFNGSRPPFGYRTVETEAIGNKGNKKKRLAVDPSEAAIIERIFSLYLYGLDGAEMGAKSIAAHLNDQGVTLRGQQWTRGRVHSMLSNETLRGDASLQLP